ncbi:hypothetical protein E2I00_002127 [Balaenoptera physalus]|uniref:PDZ domain-containing protein n=1 Tax=Balaenoptera physalus TaxID=9770 RepID=A0A643BVV8_BALPH|nr:hypothetical protein E2I00_002127 [Balaenoptera physalus]
MDLEEPRDTLSPSQDLTPDCQWDPAPGGPSNLSQMELDGLNIQDLLQQFEALPGDLVGLSPDGPPCPLHIATGHGLAPQDITDAHGLLSAEAGREDLLSLLQQDERPPSQSGPQEPPDPAPRLLQPPDDPEGDMGPQEWAEGASVEQDEGRSSSSSPEPWLETVPLVTSEEPPTSAQSPKTLASYPALQEGALSIGDRITAINGTSLVGLPLAACQAAVREVKSQTLVTLSIVHCPPVTTAIIRRPHVREQLGFCVEDGIICSLLRGGIAERGGVRVGHRIIEINGQSVVATPHARIIELLTEAHIEVHIKTMPAATYRLLTGQEQPVYL